MIYFDHLYLLVATRAGRLCWFPPVPILNKPAGDGCGGAVCCCCCCPWKLKLPGTAPVVPELPKLNICAFDCGVWTFTGADADPEKENDVETLFPIAAVPNWYGGGAELPCCPNGLVGCGCCCCEFETFPVAGLNVNDADTFWPELLLVPKMLLDDKGFTWLLLLLLLLLPPKLNIPDDGWLLELLFILLLLLVVGADEAPPNANGLPPDDCCWLFCDEALPKGEFVAWLLDEKTFDVLLLLPRTGVWPKTDAELTGADDGDPKIVGALVVMPKVEFTLPKDGFDGCKLLLVPPNENACLFSGCLSPNLPKIPVDLLSLLFIGADCPKLNADGCEGCADNAVVVLLFIVFPNPNPEFVVTGAVCGFCPNENIDGASVFGAVWFTEPNPVNAELAEFVLTVFELKGNEGADVVTVAEENIPVDWAVVADDWPNANPELELAVGIADPNEKPPPPPLFVGLFVVLPKLNPTPLATVVSGCLLNDGELVDATGEVIPPKHEK